VKKVKLQIPEVQHKQELACYPKIRLRKLEEIHICMKKLKVFGQDMGFGSLRGTYGFVGFCWLLIVKPRT
jgi:hypothetical protein